MVEQQMRMMFALTDATFCGRNPFLMQSVPQNEKQALAPADPVDATNCASHQIARVAKPRVTPDAIKLKAQRQPSRPPSMAQRDGVAMHPAE